MKTINQAAKAQILASLASAGLNEHEAEMVFRARTLDPNPPKGEPLTVKASVGDPTAIDVFIYGDIGIDPWTGEGNNAKQLIDSLPTLNAAKEINFYVNSGGGDVFEADAMVAVINRLTARKVMHVDGIAASAASYLIQAGDERRVSEHALVMIHDAWGFAMGNSRDMEGMVTVLEKIDGQIAGIYARRSGKKADSFRKLMDDETWFSAQEAIDAGLADKMVVGKKAAARLDPSRYAKMPMWARENLTTFDPAIPAIPLKLQIADHEHFLHRSRVKHGHPLVTGKN